MSALILPLQHHTRGSVQCNKARKKEKRKGQTEIVLIHKWHNFLGFPHVSAGKESPCNAVDLG